MSYPMPYPAAPPKKPRPSAKWFAVGGTMIVVGVVLFVVLIVLAVKNFAHVDETVPADGAPHAISVEAGRTYLVWNQAGRDNACGFVQPDGATPTSGLGSSSFDRTSGGSSWHGALYLEPTANQVVVTCDSSAGPVQIGPKPNVGAFVGLLLGAIAAGVLLGLSGLVMLVVVGILFATRPRRDPNLTPAR